MLENCDTFEGGGARGSTYRKKPGFARSDVIGLGDRVPVLYNKHGEFVTMR
jgi:hypothetical protein